jgi:hypothetical protein
LTTATEAAAQPRDGSAAIPFEWGDGAHVFRLGLKQLRELQAKTDCGPEELYWRIRKGQWRIDDLRETIRIGLIGGGMELEKANGLMRLHFDDCPYKPQCEPAAAILLAALFGPPDDAVGKAGRRGTQESADASPSPNSSVSRPPSG